MFLQYVNFGPLAAEIISLVWGTPGNFNGFHVLAALLDSQTAALNRGRHLYSAGRPSRWALAHISSSYCNVRAKRLLFMGKLLLHARALLSCYHVLVSIVISVF